VLNARGRGDRLGGFLPRPLGPVASKARSRQQLSQKNVKKRVKVGTQIQLISSNGKHYEKQNADLNGPVTSDREFGRELLPTMARRALERGPRDDGHDLVTGYARSGEPPTGSMSRSSACRQLSTKFRGEAKHPHKEQKSKANTYRQP
jgi:hypothetical protein